MWHRSDYPFRISGGKFRDKETQVLIPVQSPINNIIKRGGCGCRSEMLTAAFHACWKPLCNSVTWVFLTLLCTGGCYPLGYYTVLSCSCFYVTGHLTWKAWDWQVSTCWVRQDFYRKAEAWLLPCLGASGVQYLRKLALGYFRSFTSVLLDFWLEGELWDGSESPHLVLPLSWSTVKWSSKTGPWTGKLPVEQLQLGLQ